GKDGLFVGLLPPGRDRIAAQPAIKREPAELAARRLRRRWAAPVAQRQIVQRANSNVVHRGLPATSSRYLPRNHIIHYRGTSRADRHGKNAQRKRQLRAYRGSGGSLLGGTDAALARKFSHRDRADTAAAHSRPCPHQTGGRAGE